MGFVLRASSLHAASDGPFGRVAPVVLALAKDTGGDLAKMNANDGAIAIGHPLGCSGAHLMS